jgi:hypothetical protein
MQRSSCLPFLFLSIVSILLTTGGYLRAGVVVVPDALETVEGNQSSQFLTGDPRATSIRYQQVFSASEFIDTGIGMITEIAFRPDAAQGTPFSTTLSNVRVSLSTTLSAPDGLSSTFADNIGSDETVVFSGDLSFGSADLPGPGTTQAFDIIVGLITPFLYDPSMGNLLLDFQRDGSPLSPLGVSFDAHEAVGDSISRAFGSRDSATAQFGVDSTGLVARFDVSPLPDASPVPEAGSLIAWGTCIVACLVAAGWRRRRSAGT